MFYSNELNILTLLFLLDLCQEYLTVFDSMVGSFTVGTCNCGAVLGKVTMLSIVIADERGGELSEMVNGFDCSWFNIYIWFTRLGK